MKRFNNEPSSSGRHVPVDLQLSDSPVYFIGPANRSNPMSQVRTKLLGTVHFYDRKIKWNRVTLQFVGKAGIDIEAPRSSLPPGFAADDSASTRIHTVVPICEVEKELIFSGEESIEFGLHLPSHLPASSRTNHSFVEYTLIANFSAGTFFKKYKTHKTVTIHRHYLPSLSAMIPTMEYSGVKEWFEWSVELPKATAIQSGEIVIAFRCSVEKERVEVDRVELAVDEIENYRFCTKQGVHNLPPIVTRFPSATYHMPSFSEYSDTHFIRVPLSVSKDPKVRSIHTHQFDPFLEISHRCRLTVHFNKLPNIEIEPLVLGFPIIITDYPSSSIPEPTLSNNLTYTETETSQPNGRTVVGGDDAVNVDLDLPEYTPRYEEHTSL
ncbi:hypothetical protein G6F46_002284 [Rhizopus delemar]|uniref:Arrestin-like N-terminal domain-containing protein n=3 Tax=Rhizopus TaxID=4842 RepID=I1BTR6_RHIO9|nr:hypothetical protein RO3G_04301 [Rhizopus delemar RA 99-880]KAG1465149.1 hypothetical protein G6F55_001322 [Rhizopus delemar]KAG1549518.1 hypothetical protein G6F51_003007 [Rhizopus arrhizus]KAG1502374.1 hypothetical protein G6F54_002409 [Rhizopus delemar]KAG1516781.1 hypothetical protein G6F53_001887 [Rhizopus delemar]|eukprot:EIE79596.1 hypothetical protein RO3G_04301 [Rhizopus delemar RA 99-880]